jgi:hypothetical protein
MTSRVQLCYQECLQWTREERRLLSRLLLESLAPFEDDDVAQAWEDEIAKRIAELDSGQVQLIPAEVVHQELQAIIDEYKRK